MNETRTSKRSGRFLAPLLALVLALALAPTAASAAPTSDYDVADSTVTITGLLDGDTVTAYLIADADIDENNNLSYTFASGLPEAYDSVEELAAVTSDGSSFVERSDMQSAAAAIASSIATGSGVASATADGDTAMLTLGSGYYLVRVTSTSGETRVYQNMVVDVSPVANADGNYDPKDDQELAVKSTGVDVQKGVGSAYAPRTDAYQVGDAVPFKVTTAIPNYPKPALYATFAITDTPTAGLSIDTDSITVTGATTSDYTISATEAGYTITFNEEFILDNPGQAIEVTYEATLTSDAFSHDPEDVTGNTAKVTFNPNPYSDGTSEPESTTVVQTYGYVFPKVDADGAALAGAIFTLYDSNGNVVKDENGADITSTSTIVDGVAYVYFEDLKAGSYTAKETTVPAGHLKAPDQTFTLSESACTDDNPATSVVENNYLVETEPVVDPDQPSLPVTGGAGTFAVTAGGVILIAGALAVILKLRRREDELE